MLDLVSTAYFEVVFDKDAEGLSGQFTSVSGLSMEFEYDTYLEGGSNYPKHFFKNIVPQTLVLEQGTVVTADALAKWIAAVNQGTMTTLNGVITLKDHTGKAKRSWVIQDAYPVKYIGPSLDSMKSELAVTRIELKHNGCI